MKYYTLSVEDCEDLFQTTFPKAVSAYKPGKVSFKNYLFLVATRKAIDLWRSTASLPPFTPLPALIVMAKERADELVIRADMTKLIHEALSFLTEEEKFAFCAHHVDGRPWDEVAAQLGRKSEPLRVGITKKLLRARRKIALKLMCSPTKSTGFVPPPSEND